MSRCPARKEFGFTIPLVLSSIARRYPALSLRCSVAKSHGSHRRLCRAEREADRGSRRRVPCASRAP